MNNQNLTAKVVIEKRMLQGSDDDLQRFATVYFGGDEYRIYAPAPAKGEPLEWLEHSYVQRPSRDTPYAELETDPNTKSFVLNAVKDELKRSRASTVNAGGNSDTHFYHVRLHSAVAPQVEVKFDLIRSELEKRVLEPYKNFQPIVLGGRTILIEDLQRLEVFVSPYPSSKFQPMTAELAKTGGYWDILESDIRNVTDELVTTPAVTVIPQKTNAVELLCTRFHDVAKQLRKRHDDRATLDVNDEYDVQDLLHALLRVFFDDVRPEEWSPSYAGKSARMDFLLPREHVVIEVKKARQGLGAKELGSQLIEDIARYKTHPSCKRLICFVYDPEGRVANPRGIESDLSENENEFEITVIIAP